jgi:hypothetical protein
MAEKGSVTQCVGKKRYATLDYAEGMAVKLTAKPKAKPITIFQPGPFGGNEPKDGKVYLEGPHYPEAHRWYAEAWLKDGYVVKVK